MDCETKSHSHLAAGLHEAAQELGIHTNSLSHPKLLPCILTMLLRADRKAMGEFNNSELTIPKAEKEQERYFSLPTALPFLSFLFFFFFLCS